MPALKLTRRLGIGESINMNKDTNLIFEAYRKVNEASLSYDREGNAYDSLQGYHNANVAKEQKTNIVPSDEEIQAALTTFKSKSTVEEVKEAINAVIEYYKPTSEEALKDYMYEDYCDINNLGLGVGKQQYPYKKDAVAEVAVRLADTKRMWRQKKERNARGENAEETSKLTMDILIKAIETSLQPFRFECEVCYLGQVMDVLEKMGFKLFGAAGPDREAFNGIWKKFLSENAYCYDMSATDSYDMDEETPRFSENKIEKNGPGEYLFMEGSGKGPDVYLACEFAKKHGYKKLILNGLS